MRRAHRSGCIPGETCPVSSNCLSAVVRRPFAFAKTPLAEEAQLVAARAMEAIAGRLPEQQPEIF